MAASLSGFAAISQTFSRSNEREQKDRITLLPLPSSRSSLFSLSSSLPTAISVEFLWELSDIHICLLLHQKFQPRPAQPTSSPLSYKGFAATYDISLPSYLPIQLPLSCPPLLIPFQPPSIHASFSSYLRSTSSTPENLPIRSFSSPLSIFFGRKEGL